MQVNEVWTTGDHARNATGGDYTTGVVWSKEGRGRYRAARYSSCEIAEHCAGCGQYYQYWQPDPCGCTDDERRNGRVVGWRDVPAWVRKEMR